MLRIEKWLKCYVQGLNAVMKHTVNKMASGDALVILDVLKAVTYVIRIVKQSNLNIPQDHALVQERGICVETTHDVVESFLKSVHHLREVKSDSVHVKLCSLT